MLPWLCGQEASTAGQRDLRGPSEVLTIVYLTPKVVSSGGFFPDGVSGPL